MNETSSTISMASLSLTQLQSAITKTANLGQVPTSASNSLSFAGQTLSQKCDVLLKMKYSDDKAEITVNCEKIVIGSMLIKDIKLALSSS